MTPDAYLAAILQREAVDTGIFSPVRAVQGILDPVIRKWANRYLGSVTPSGSFAKGTANRSGTDIDLFVSLLPSTQESLKDIYDSLSNALTQAGYQPRPQNVSLGVRVNGLDVDLVPGKQQTFLTTDHSLWRRKAATWTKTNVLTHIAHVRGSGHFDETRIIKLWRSQKGLEFPSFYLELAVIAALTPRTLLTSIMGTLCGPARENLHLPARYVSWRALRRPRQHQQHHFR